MATAMAPGSNPAPAGASSSGRPLPQPQYTTPKGPVNPPGSPAPDCGPFVAVILRARCRPELQIVASTEREMTQLEAELAVARRLMQTGQGLLP